MDNTIKDHLEKINILTAFEAKPSSNLRDALEGFQTKELMVIADNLAIRYETVDKDFLIDNVFKGIKDTERIENALLITRDYEFELFEKLIKEEFIQDNAMPFGITSYLIEKYLIFSFYNDDKIYFLVPEEIKNSYSKIDKSKFNKKFEHYKKIYQYLKICINLYGAVRKKKFVEIFNHYNEEKLNQAEFSEILNYILSRQQPFFQDEDFIASDYFDSENYDELDFILVDNDGISYYMPPKEKFLKYEDEGYFEFTPQIQKLKDYIIKNMCKDEEKVNNLISDIELVCSLEDPFQYVLNEFARYEIFFSNESQLYEITPLILDVYNNTRTWGNHGHTPYEVHFITGEPLPVQSFDNLFIPTKKGVKQLKLNNFSPCLCGSGKKYLKCCAQYNLEVKD